MSIVAVVEKDSIRLPPGVHLPDGTTVSVQTIEQREVSKAKESFGHRYSRFTGIVKDAPADLAERHDDYLRQASLDSHA